MSGRRLDGIDDNIVTSASALEQMSHGTVAWIFKRRGTGYRTALGFATSTNNTQWACGWNDSNAVYAWTDAGSNGPSVASTTTHYLVVFRKASGIATPRYSVKDMGTGTWVHQDGDAAIGDGPVAGNGGVCEFDWGGGELADADFYVRAAKSNVVLWTADAAGDGAIEAAGLDTSLFAWLEAGFDSVWAFNQASTSDPVLDLMDDADQTSIVGTTVVTGDDPSGFSFDLGTTRQFLRDTQTEQGTGGTVYDLSETQGTGATLAPSVNSGTYVEAARWQRTVGDAVTGTAFPTGLDVSAISASADYRWRVQRLNSAGVVQASSAYSSIRATTGTWTQTLLLDTTWAAGDILALSLELRRSSGGGSRSITVNVQDADSYLDAELAAGGGGNATLAAALPALIASLTGTVEVDANLAGILPGLTASFSASSDSQVDATITATLPGLAGSLTGTVDIDGGIAAVLPALVGSFTAGVDVGAALAGMLPALSAAFSAASLRFAEDIHSSGRYFVDGNGDPILVRGESPWAMMVDLSSAEMDTYLGNRAGYGTNLALAGLVGSTGLGGPADSGATYDGILPFTGGDPTVFNETYWARMDSYIAKARDLGIGLLLYPMDGWNTLPGTIFAPGSVTTGQCQTYGQTLATRYLAEPHILWAFGGDYDGNNSQINELFDACLTGIRAAGDTRPVTMQLIYETSESHNVAYWETRVDWDYVYTYYVTYKGVSDGYDWTWSTSPTTKPALFAEGAYENSGGGHPGTDLVIRRQAAWALTSGSPGDFSGQEGVWQFDTGWETLLDTTAASQLQAIRDTIEGVDWWTLVPDDANQLVTAGRGTRITTDAVVFPSDNTYVTAGRSADGSLAVIYMPAASNAITVDMGQIGASPTATWVDPTSGATVAETPGSTYSRSTLNGAGDGDWLLILTGGAVDLDAQLAASLPALTGSLTGTVVNDAQLSAVLPTLTAGFDGATLVQAALGGTLPQLTAAFTLSDPSVTLVNLDFVALAPVFTHGGTSVEMVDRTATAPELGHGDTTATLGHGQPGEPTT